MAVSAVAAVVEVAAEDASQMMLMVAYVASS